MPEPATASVEESTTSASATIAGLGVAVPPRVVTNAELAPRLGVSEEWIVTRTGVRERHIAEQEDRLAALGADAGRAALERAGVDAADLDLVIVATVAGDQLLPNASPVVAHELGAEPVEAIDIGAGCTGFLAGLDMASSKIEAGRARNALVVCAELMSRVTDPDDRATAALFGDGAGAAVVGPPGAGASVGPILLACDGAGAPAIWADQSERVIHMQGHDTFRAAVARLSEATLAAAERASITLQEVDLFVYHQANARILAAVRERLGLDGERVFECIDRYGNTSSATIPIALAEAQAEARLTPGDRVLLAAFGAGFSWGAGVIEWA